MQENNITGIMLKSKEYTKMKKVYEKVWFKLRGHYFNYTEDCELIEYPVAEIKEYFIDKKVNVTHSEENEKIDAKTGATTTITTSKKLSMSYFDIWRLDEDKKAYMKVEFNPNVKKVSPTTFNMFTGFNHFDHLKPQEKDLYIILDHINSLCGFDKDMYEGYIAYLAHIIQRPYELPHSMHVFIGVQGVGKDKHYSFMESVFSEKYCLITSKLENIVGKFNSLMGGKLFVVVNESDPIESKQREAGLKDVATASTLIIEGKYKDAIKTNNYARVNMYSNKAFAFPMESGARRPRISRTSSKYINLTPAEKNKYFSKLISQLEDENYQYAFLRYLQDYDISKFDFQKVIKSKLHEELEKHCAPTLALFLAKYITSGDDEEVKEEVIKVRSMTLFNAYNKWIEINKFKYQTDTKKFKFDLINTYGILEPKMNNGYPIYCINVKDMKSLLTNKFMIDFNVDIDDEKIKPEVADNKDLDTGIDTSDQSINQITESENIIKELKMKLFIAEHKEEFEELYTLREKQKRQSHLREEAFIKLPEVLEKLPEVNHDIKQFFSDIDLF
jgi:hypothetical protein